MTINIKELIKFSRTLNILYVEDNISLRKETADMFDDFFNKITISVDGKDGYEKYKKYFEINNKYFDLIVTDINMPNLDGIEMSKLILSLNSKQPILIVSAHNESDKLQELINIGISRFIHKPIILKDFIEIMIDISDDIKNTDLR